MPTTPTRPSPSRFAATRWSIVLAAGRLPAGSAARHALGELAQMYWFPLYAFLRRQGHSPAHAEDLVQGFFLHLLEKDSLAAADRTRGKFRAFLLASLKNFLLNEHDKTQTQKRGGHRQLLSLDSLAAEARYAAEPAHDMTPERLFERRWTLALLDQVLNRLRDEYAHRNQQNLFAHLKHLLIGEPGEAYAHIAQQLQMTEGSVKVAAHRLRRRYRELLREEIAQTLSDPALIDEEIRQLLATL